MRKSNGSMVGWGGGSIRCVVGAIVASLAVGVGASDALAQEHGFGATKVCHERCVGEATDCTMTARYLDDFDDVLVLTNAWDEVQSGGGTVRVPAVGNLPIIAVEGNAACTDDGGTCDRATGANCALPCRLGQSGSTTGGMPGLTGDGRVRFAQQEYVIQGDDPANLGDTVKFTWSDECNSGRNDCPQGSLTTPAGSNTIIPNCDDGNACTTDGCEAGVCSHDADCDGPDDCDDGDACTEDDCNADGCCEHEVVTCNDGSACTEDSCDRATGCVFTPITCQDGDACTQDTCDAGSGCVYTPIVCNDGSACTEDSCARETGCVYTSITCDDGDACTADACDPSTGCTHTPIACNDGNVCTDDRCEGGDCVYTPRDVDDQDACTTDACDPVTGPSHTPITCDDQNLCTTDSCAPASGCVYTPVVCNDGDECTADSCDGATGVCVYAPIEPPPRGCGEAFAGCTPGFWKQKQHFQYWNVYSTSDLVSAVFGVDPTGDPTLLQAMMTGGGGEFALLRHAVAALLNAANDEVNYLYATQEIINLVQEAFTTGEFERVKNLLAAQNELGCTVNTSRSGSTTSGKESSPRSLSEMR